MRIDPTPDERRSFQSALQPLVSIERRTFDVAEWVLYYEALADIPHPLLVAAVASMVRETRRYPFRPSDIRAAAERERQAILAAHPHQPCVACRESCGFVEVVDPAGVRRMMRCDCFTRYLREIDAMGIPRTPLALPAAESTTEDSYA